MALSREAVRFGVVPGIAQLTDTLARSFQRQQELDARFAEKELELGRKKDAKRISNAQKLVKTKLATTDLSDDDVKSHVAQSRFGFDEAQYGRDVQMLSDTKSLSTDKDEKEYATKELLSRKRGKLMQDANVDTILNSSKGDGYKLSALASDTGDIGLANAAAMLLENDAPPEFQQELQGEINAANNPELLNQLLQQRQSAYDSGDDDTARQLQGRLDQDFYGARDEPLLEKLQVIQEQQRLEQYGQLPAHEQIALAGVPQLNTVQNDLLESVKAPDPAMQEEFMQGAAQAMQQGMPLPEYIGKARGADQGRKAEQMMANQIIRGAYANLPSGETALAAAMLGDFTGGRAGDTVRRDFSSDKMNQNNFVEARADLLDRGYEPATASAVASLAARLKPSGELKPEKLLSLANKTKEDIMADRSVSNSSKRIIIDMLESTGSSNLSNEGRDVMDVFNQQEALAQMQQIEDQQRKADVTGTLPSLSGPTVDNEIAIRALLNRGL